MDCGFNWEHNTLINELIQGLEYAKQLRPHLNSTTSSSSYENQELLLQRILSSYEKSLSILKWTGSVSAQSPQHYVAPPTSTGAPVSSVSIDGSPTSDDMNRSFKDHQDLRCVSKKRKLMATRTEQVRVSADNGFEGPTDDGCSWRKYGQKDILGAKYPRSYYRCTYRLMQNCWATKQVQRSDDDPTVFEITYKGTHNCNQASVINSAAQPMISQEKHEFKKQSEHQSTQQQSNQMLENLRANLRVSTNDLDRKETSCGFSFPPTFSGLADENPHFQISHVDDNLVRGYSPSFVSPTTPESNYYSVSSCQMNGFGGGVHNFHHSESDLTDLFSANNSSTSSPIVGLEFSLDNVDLDPNFPFDNEFFR